MAVALLFPFAGFAHDGHGVTGGYTITHYFVEPEHAVYTWSFIAAALVLARYLRGRKASR